MPEAAVITGDLRPEVLSQQLLAPVFTPLGLRFRLAVAVCALGTLLGFGLMGYTIAEGIGLWGNNIPVAWAFAIINFVWWIGIGHAGTFISAILLLLEQKWRTSINRVAEAMTLFAVAQAAIFPLLHLGRPWFFYWLIPYPATMQVWPNFKSALPWDAAAVFTYGTVSLLFWYLGLVPDLAAARDRAPGKIGRIIYGIFALGWRGSAEHWRHYRVAYGLLAGLATPLVISVHSVVSTDFAITLIPGWHETIFPPYFVSGAIYSGFAMVLILAVPVRRVFHLQNVITRRHIEAIGKMLLVTGWIVAYSYICEWFYSWYSGDQAEIYVFWHQYLFGPGAPVIWAALFCNMVVPQLFWSRRIRNNDLLCWTISVLVLLGMWSERYMIIVSSLQRDFLPSSWYDYAPTWVDWGIFVGTLSFFALLFLLFIRFVPFIPTAEILELAGETRREHRQRREAAS
jgi:molybdopterin-containing oxidoreductase family membrane subunit